MQADLVREPRAQRHHRQANDHTRLRESAVLFHPVLTTAQQRPDHQQRHGDKTHTGPDIHQRVRGIAVKTGQHHREQTPSRGVVHGARAEGHRPHRRAREFFEMDDPRQHGKRGDAHGRAEEKHGLHQTRALGEQLCVMIEHPRQTRAEDKRSDHARDGNRDGAGHFFPHDIDPEFHAHDEHVERQPELRGGEQIALRVPRFLSQIPRKKPRLRVRREQTEQRRPQQNPGDHFRNHLRLTELRGHRADQPAEKQDDRDLEEKLNG